ncbi:MAG: hypothetical protein MZV63_41535 [Marinilabiliales bacterium]|nr:hypothetical protein [Marinilabiliales bacterium]
MYRGFWREFDSGECIPEMAGRNIKAHFDFDMAKDEQIVIKCGLSAVSMDGALENPRRRSRDGILIRCANRPARHGNQS